MSFRTGLDIEQGDPLISEDISVRVVEGSLFDFKENGLE